MARILVVDDDVQVRKFISMSLSRAGHEVSGAGNGNECLKSLGAAPFDLVITDIIMPDKEGIETIIEVRRTHPEVKIIAISGGGRVGPESYLLTAKGLGAMDTLQKPFTTEQLLATVQNVLTA